MVLNNKSANRRIVFWFPFSLVVVLAMAIMLVLCASDRIDKVFLLESRYSGYFHVLKNIKTISAYDFLDGSEVLENYTDADIYQLKKRRLAFVKKDGFAEAEPKDILFFIDVQRNTYPSTENILLCFDDNTGVEISLYESGKANYVIVDNYGQIVSEKQTIRMDEPLFFQIEGITNLNHKYDENDNIIYEFRTNSAGEAKADINGIAGTIREYDKDGNVTVLKYLDSEGHLIDGPLGYAEVYRKYSNKHIVYEKYYSSNGNETISFAGYSAIEQEWDGEVLLSRTYLDVNNNPINRIDGYCKATWERNDHGTRILQLNDNDGAEVPLEGKNLVRNVGYGKDGWSEWFKPQYGVANSSIHLGDINLGSKNVGDCITCQVEIEFKNVSPTKEGDFWLRAQGAQDGYWITENVWNDNLVSLKEAPQDGLYRFTSTVTVSEGMTNVSFFDLDFRCDYWNSGYFRVRNVKIERGSVAGEWSPGL